MNTFIRERISRTGRKKSASECAVNLARMPDVFSTTQDRLYTVDEKMYVYNMNEHTITRHGSISKAVLTLLAPDSI